MGDASTLFTNSFFVCGVCVFMCTYIYLNMWIDDWEEAYRSLRHVVKEYLLLEEETERENNTSPDNASIGVCLPVQLIISLHSFCRGVKCIYKQYYKLVVYNLFLSASSNEPEEKPPLPLSKSESGMVTSHSATALDPTDLSYRNYFTKIQAELSPQKSPTVSFNMYDEKCIVNEACKCMLNRHAFQNQICGKIITNCLTGSSLSHLHSPFLHV